MQESTGALPPPEGIRPLEPSDPTTLGSCSVLGRLGEGGMGIVFLGRDADDRLVAIKMIRAELAADQAFRARFRDEVTNARRVASFCTAQVIEHGEDDGRPFLVTEYVAGTPLDEYIAENGPLPAATLHGVAVGVAAALTAIHTAGLVHRDLKPPNVLLSVSGPRVIDFGIARALDATSKHTQTGAVVGSPGWMAPEQVLDGEISTAIDVFSWGCLVAFAGSGHNPYGRGNVFAMAARVGRIDPDLAGLPDTLAEVVARTLVKDASARPTAQGLLLSLVGGRAPDAQAAEGRLGAAPAAPPDDPAPLFDWVPPPAWTPPPWAPPRWTPPPAPPPQTPPPALPPQTPRPVPPMTPPPARWTPPPPPGPPSPTMLVAPPRPKPNRQGGSSCLVAIIVALGLFVITVIIGIIGWVTSAGEAENSRGHALHPVRAECGAPSPGRCSASRA